MTNVSIALSLGLLSAPPLPAADAGPIAIVYGLSGAASVRVPPARAPRPAQRFEWLPAGAEVEVAEGGTLLLAFASGSRYELGGGTAVTLAAPSGFGASRGPVRALPSVSPLPRLPGLAAEAKPGARAGALRVRGTRIVGLYPADEANVLPDEAVLFFESLPGTPRYKVRVEDEIGATVFEAEVGTSSVVVSPGVLKPGARYHWTVRSLGESASARGEADFGVVTRESLAAREALRHSLEGLADPESRALLAEVDGQLGLWLEAHREFRAALAQAPADASLQAALQRLAGLIPASVRDAKP